MAKRNYFSVMVVGENPDELMAKFDKNLKVGPYVVYSKDDAERLRNNEMDVLRRLLSMNVLNQTQEAYILEKLDNIQQSTVDEYFETLSERMEIDKDGNAISDANPDGKYDYYSIGRRFSVPLKLYDGKDTWQARNKDVNFESMHLANTITYETVWEMFKEGRVPETEEEKTLYENMKTLDNYFDSFKTKDEYVAYNTAFFHYAYLDKDGWKDMDDLGENPQQWVINFFDRFVIGLDPDDLITVFECQLID